MTFQPDDLYCTRSLEPVASTWQGIFAPMLYSATYTIPRDGVTEDIDSDGDGYPDYLDAYPTDPFRH